MTQLSATRDGEVLAPEIPGQQQLHFDPSRKQKKQTPSHSPAHVYSATMRNRATTTLTNPKIRQSWSKYNLFNLTRLRNPPTQLRTHFQQKFRAKSVARAYHGEQVRESQWQRMFSSRIRSVIPMDPERLAADDGSKTAAGRGSGLEEIDRVKLGNQRSKQFIPFTQMTFAPLERRLDVAVFRALFASSTRQARQFVIHGAVTVNGQKMRYPGYLLNPGDLFQVDPDRVMYATGAPKSRSDRREARALRKKKSEGQEAKEAEGEEKDTAAAEESKELAEEETKEQPKEDPRKVLKGLMAQAKNIMATGQDVLPAKRKQELRGFQKAVRRVLSRSASSTVLTDNLEAQFAELTQLLKAKRAEKKKADRQGGNDPKDAQSSKPEASNAPKQADAPEGAAAAAAKEAQPGEALTEAFRQATENPEQEPDTSELTDEEFDVLKRAMVQMRDNPIDHSKPYGTPWQPREFMSAFAFVPRYLEVNHNICAAVYLRHPVARPGASEVPSPFGEVVGTGAFAWYLRRR